MDLYIGPYWIQPGAKGSRRDQKINLEILEEGGVGGPSNLPRLRDHE